MLLSSRPSRAPSRPSFPGAGERARLSIEGVRAPIVTRVARRREDALVVTQELPFLRLGSRVLAEDGRAARIARVAVDCETEDTFLYANITNISEMGIFVRTQEPLEVGTRLTLKFSPPGTEEPFIATGQVQWVNPVRMLADNPNPGMGIRFVNLTSEERERLVEMVHTIAYIRSSTN